MWLKYNPAEQSYTNAIYSRSPFSSLLTPQFCYQLYSNSVRHFIIIRMLEYLVENSRFSHDFFKLKCIHIHLQILLVSYD